MSEFIADVRQAVDGVEVNVDTVDAEMQEIALSGAMKTIVAFSKYESHDPLLSDTVHGNEWDIQITAHDKIGLVEDDGCIINFKGTRRSEVGIIARTGEVLDMDQVEVREEAGGDNVPRFMAYDFRIDSIFKTNGPQLNANASKTEEQQRLKGQEHMFESISAAFQQALVKGGGGGQTSIQEVADFITALTPDQGSSLLDSAGHKSLMPGDEPEEKDEALDLSGIVEKK